jgi:hypothetical protein
MRVRFSDSEQWSSPVKPPRSQNYVKPHDARTRVRLGISRTVSGLPAALSASRAPRKTVPCFEPRVRIALGPRALLRIGPRGSLNGTPNCSPPPPLRLGDARPPCCGPGTGRKAAVEATSPLARFDPHGTRLALPIPCAASRPLLSGERGAVAPQAECPQLAAGCSHPAIGGWSRYADALRLDNERSHADANRAKLRTGFHCLPADLWKLGARSFPEQQLLAARAPVGSFLFEPAILSFPVLALRLHNARTRTAAEIPARP